LILYADILFLVDFSMDFLTLRLCAAFTHRPAVLWRMSIASLVGATIGVGLVIADIDGAVTFIGGIFLSMVMTAICFGVGRSKGGFIRQCLLVWGCGAITGGCMSLLMSMGTPVYFKNEQSKTPAFLPIFLLAVLFVRLFSRLLIKRVNTSTTQIMFTYRGRQATCTVLVDSGNLLRDPLTGKPVILLSRAAIPNLELSKETNLEEPMFPISANGVSGSRLLWAIKPEKLIIHGVRKDALIAVEDVPADHYGGCGGTCPLALL